MEAWRRRFAGLVSSPEELLETMGSTDDAVLEDKFGASILTALQVQTQDLRQTSQRCRLKNKVRTVAEVDVL